MKRNMELARKILLAIEQYDEAPGHSKITGASAGEITDHVQLLKSGGFVEESLGRVNLTWAGHDLLHAIRNRDFTKQA